MNRPSTKADMDRPSDCGESASPVPSASSIGSVQPLPTSSDQAEGLQATAGCGSGPSKQCKRQRILDAAEGLWADNSYELVTIRQIMARVDLPFSLATYYFGSKERLFAAVIERRAAEHIANMHRAFDRALDIARGGVPAPEDWIDALVQPVLDRFIAPDEGWRNYMRLLSRAATSNQMQAHLHPLYESYGQIARRFIDGIQRIVPQVDEANAMWAFYFIHSSALAIYLNIGTLDMLTEGKYSTSDFAAISKRFSRFFAPSLLNVDRLA